uniref:Uncharacterized protein n=1 Tax=Lepisosteus oculatus TaxID=7918 RepID=W5MW18_LEPOC
NVTVLQVYAPTTDAPEDESECFYAKIEEALEQVPKKDIIYIMGNFNAKVGSQEEANTIGQSGLGERNKAGDCLVKFCHENHLRVSNTWFMQPKCRLYTWTAPNGPHRNQIDYILCSQRWKSSVLAIKTFPGVDCGSDHELLVATIKEKFCNIKNILLVSYAVAVKNRFELLGNEDKQPDELWQEFQSTIIKTAQEHLTYKKLKKRSNWLSAETIKSRSKKSSQSRWGPRRARKDKKAYWDHRCKQMEEECRKGHTRNLFAQVKKIQTSFISFTFTARKGAIKDKNGKVLTGQQCIRSGWREYTEKLYASTSDPEPPHDDPVEIEPAILDEEVVWALKQLPDNKAPGIDCIPAEMLMPVPPVAIKAICQKIWETSRWPKDWKRSVFIPLPKKGDTWDCCNYRTIALIPHVSKVLLKIIQQRLHPIIEAELPDSSDHITNLRWITEKCHEHQKNIYICFIDYSKAFECIELDKLWKALQELHLIQLIRSFYKNQEATVRTHGEIKKVILRIKKESEKMGLHINIKKTKIMTTAGNGEVKITINSEDIECVKVFCFLGSMIERIALGRSAMSSMHQIWKSKDISLTTKCKMVHAIVFPISMYGCESWTLNKADQKRMDAFKLWCWRRLLRIPWTARVTNKEVLERTKPEISLEGKITRLRLTYFGHKAMMLGMVSGTRRGHQRTGWLDAIKTDTGLGIEQLKGKVQDQKAWREIAYRIVESR